MVDGKSWITIYYFPKIEIFIKKNYDSCVNLQPFSIFVSDIKNLVKKIKTMKNNYYCPECNANLNVGGSIILVAKVDGKKGGLVLFEPQLGAYKVIRHDDCKISKGDHAEFFCPVCSMNLSSKNDMLATIMMKDSDDDFYEIWFSEIVGENATYKVKGADVEAFGEDSPKYMNVFGSEPNY